jgi:head-tail adaptor
MAPIKVTPLIAGQLRYPITVQQPRKATPKDEFGHTNTKLDANWTEFCSRRAEVVATGAREVVSPEGDVLFAFTLYTIRVRYDNQTKQINPKMRVLFEDKILNLETCHDPNGTKTQILMTAIEQVDSEDDADGE